MRGEAGHGGARRPDHLHLDALSGARARGDVPGREPRRQLQRVGAGRSPPARPVDRDRQRGLLRSATMRYPTIVAVALVAAAGCDLFNNTLEVQNPSNVPAGGLETPANAQLLVNSAIADFECAAGAYAVDRKSTRLNPSHVRISYAVFCLEKKKKQQGDVACPVVFYSSIVA